LKALRSSKGFFFTHEKINFTISKNNMISTTANKFSKMPKGMMKRAMMHMCCCCPKIPEVDQY